jgi:1,4-dihydroxy-2-naphthoyl-CoA hydrolase
MIYPRIVHLADTDAAGVVYFASLLSICHEAYEASLQAANIDLKGFFRDTSTAIPITHAEIDFYHPVVAGDRLEIYLVPQMLTENSFEIEYQLMMGSKFVAKAKTHHVCINPQIRQKQPLSELMIQWLNREDLT